MVVVQAEGHFDPVSGRLYCDLEFASELLVLDFDAESGAISPVFL